MSDEPLSPKPGETGTSPAPLPENQPKADEHQPERTNQALEPVKASGWTDPTEVNPPGMGQPASPLNEPITHLRAETAAPDPQGAVDPGENPYHEPSAGIETAQPATPQNEPVTQEAARLQFPSESPAQAAERAPGPELNQEAIPAPRDDHPNG
jgi:hypothetical protein